MPAQHQPKVPAWPPRSAPRLFVAGPLSIEATVVLDGPQAHYLSRVMRIQPGDAVILCDDFSGEWAAEAVEAGKREITLRCKQRLREREEVPDFILCAALLKKDRFDLILEKATELGVRIIQPVLTRRCVADKLNPERARAAVIEAAEQCARTALPLIEQPMTLDRLLSQWNQDRTLFFADETGGEPAATAFARHEAPAGLLIGPEGGFTDEERESVRKHPQARPVSLGPRILRGETAAIAGTCLWMACAGDWGK